MSTPDLDFNEEFKAQAIFRIDESVRMLTKSLELLREEEIWKRPNNSSNSVGNLLLHLSGNIEQYGIASLGEIVDKRGRELEFNTHGGYTKEVLWNQFIATVDKAKKTISQASVAQLMKEREVQGFTFSGIGVVLHVVEHLSYHTGQIAYWVKILKDQDLGFYDGMDLTIKNKD